MPLNDQDARALTYLAKRIRQETHGANQWDEAGILAKVSELRGQGLAQAAERVIRHAADTAAKTPGAILRPFLPDAQTPAVPRVPYDPATHCDICFKLADQHRDHDGHGFISRTDALRRREGLEGVAAAVDYARQAIGDSKTRKDGAA